MTRANMLPKSAGEAEATPPPRVSEATRDPTAIGAIGGGGEGTEAKETEEAAASA